jgi:hypothetical protein
MAKKTFEYPQDKRAAYRTLIDRFPFDEEGKENFCNFIMVLDEIEEEQKDSLWGYRKYAVLRGGKIAEGHPTEIGYADEQKVPAIFNVRIVTDKSGKKPVFLAYSMTACCVAQGTTRKKLLKAMHFEIERTLELKEQQIPHPIIMEVDACIGNGDLFFHESVKERQELYEPLYLEIKKSKERHRQIEEAFVNPGRTRLIDWEE